MYWGDMIFMKFFQMHLTLPQKNFLIHWTDKNIISITHLEQIMDQYPWNQNKSTPPGPSPNSV